MSQKLKLGGIINNIKKNNKINFMNCKKVIFGLAVIIMCVALGPQTSMAADVLSVTTNTGPSSGDTLPTISGEVDDTLNAPGIGRITVRKEITNGAPNTTYTFNFSLSGTGIVIPLNFSITVIADANGYATAGRSINVIIPPLIPASFSVTENVTFGWRELPTPFPCNNLRPGAGGSDVCLIQNERMVANNTSDSSVMPITQTLTMGSSGAAVKNLQQALMSAGYGIPAGATGYFGIQTRAAVSQFQIDQGWEATGYAGPYTFEALNEKLVLSSPAPDFLSAVNLDAPNAGPPLLQVLESYQCHLPMLVASPQMLLPS